LLRRGKEEDIQSSMKKGFHLAKTRRGRARITAKIYHKAAL
jgi:hypothetical protein